MQCELTVLVSMAQIASALVLGGAGLYFTTRQISISRDKLRLDHFDKRFAVYEAARRFLERASQQGQVSPQDENDFFRRDARHNFPLQGPVRSHLPR